MDVVNVKTRTLGQLCVYKISWAQSYAMSWLRVTVVATHSKLT